MLLEKLTGLISKKNLHGALEKKNIESHISEKSIFELFYYLHIYYNKTEKDRKQGDEEEKK